MLEQETLAGNTFAFGLTVWMGQHSVPDEGILAAITHSASPDISQEGLFYRVTSVPRWPCTEIDCWQV